MKLLDIYSYLLSNWINGGSFIQRSRMQATDIRCDYNIVFTKSAVKKIYRLSGIKPENLDLGFIDFIRDKMFELNPEVEVIISITNYPVRVDVKSDKFNRAMGRANEGYSTYKDVFDSQSGLARLTGKTYRTPNGGSIRITRERLDNLKQVFVSYLTVFNKVSSGETTTLTTIFFEVVGKTIKQVKQAGFDLEGLLSPLNIFCTEIKSVNKTYMNEFGPAVPPPMKLNKKFLPQQLFTEENLAAFSSYKSRGLVCDRGILLGMDFRSRLPFMADIFAAPSAQNFLLMGKTGSGKTYAAFQMALSALALGQYVSAIDIKGREWARISQLCQSKILTFDAKHPSFINTLRLDDLQVTIKNAGELFDTAVKGTVTLLMLIVNLQPDEGNPNDLELVLREAVNKLYSMRGVSPNNISSFKETAGIKYADLLPVLENLTSTVTYTSDQKKMLVLARSRCHAYIGDSGIFADSFKNELTLADVMDTPLVIYEFNKNQNAMADSLDVIRIFMVQFLDSKKKAMLRDRGKFLFAFYEELQRCEQFGNLLEYICADVTGSRSNNAVVVLLMNSLKVLTGDRARDIRSNITSFLCGNVEHNDIRTIASDFNQPWLANQLELFSNHQNIYRNCFAACIDTGAGDVLQTVYKVQLPEKLRSMFQTRTTLESVS